MLKRKEEIYTFRTKISYKLPIVYSNLISIKTQILLKNLEIFSESKSTKVFKKEEQYTYQISSPVN